MNTAGTGPERNRLDPPSRDHVRDAGAPGEPQGPGLGSEALRRPVRVAELPEDLWRPASWRTRALPPPSGPAWAVRATVALVVAYNPLVNEVIPEALYVPANLVVAAALAWLAWRAGATADLLGMRRDRAGRGLAVGLKAGALAVLVVGLLTALPWTRSYLADDRFVGMPGTEVLYETLGRIPLGTAAGEEIIFRGSCSDCSCAASRCAVQCSPRPYSSVSGTSCQRSTLWRPIRRVTSWTLRSGSALRLRVPWSRPPSPASSSHGCASGPRASWRPSCSTWRSTARPTWPGGWSRATGGLRER